MCVCVAAASRCTFRLNRTRAASMFFSRLVKEVNRLTGVYFLPKTDIKKSLNNLEKKKRAAHSGAVFSAPALRLDCRRTAETFTHTRVLHLHVSNLPTDVPRGRGQFTRASAVSHCHSTTASGRTRLYYYPGNGDFQFSLHTAKRMNERSVYSSGKGASRPPTLTPRCQSVLLWERLLLPGSEGVAPHLFPSTRTFTEQHENTRLRRDM